MMVRRVENAPKVIGSVPIERMKKGHPWNPSRRSFISIASLVPLGARATTSAPTDWGLSGGGYNAEALKLLRHMRFCVRQEKEDPNIDLYNKNMKKEMTDFSSFYLANKRSGPAINNLRTDISFLATHYTNTGFKTPLKADARDKLLASIADSEATIVASQEAASMAPATSDVAKPPIGKANKQSAESKYGNDDSAKASAMQSRLKANNPDAFDGEGFKVKF